MIQVYILLGAVAVAFSAGWKVSDWRNDAQQLAVQEAISQAQDAFSDANLLLGQQLEERLGKLRIVNKTINNEVHREIRTNTVYTDANCAIPASAVQLLNAARGHPAATGTGKPNATVPATPPTGSKADAPR